MEIVWQMAPVTMLLVSRDNIAMKEIVLKFPPILVRASLANLENIVLQGVAPLSRIHAQE